MNLRELRKWHWQQAMQNRGHAEWRERSGEYEATANQRSHTQVYHNKANFHIRAVQALNDVVMGTAERDIDRDNVERAAQAEHKRRKHA